MDLEFRHVDTLRGDADLMAYWVALIMSGGIKYRLAEVKDPGIQDVEAMLSNPGNINFMAFDRLTQRVAGEVMITNFQGLSAMVHFSIHPEFHGPKAVEIAKQGARFLFSLNHPLGMKLHTLIGLTPINNRLAIRLIKKVGYTIKSTLTNTFILANNENRVVDGLLSQLTLKDLDEANDGK